MKRVCLSIAGFDGSGGAGLQADLKTFAALGCYGVTVLTAIPVQNTGGVRGCYSIPLSCIEEQLEAIFDDVIPDAIKVGVLFSADVITLVADFLRKKASRIPLVVDPVMIAKSGDHLLESTAVESLKENIIPLASLLTPNLPEAETLVPGVADKTQLLERLLSLGCERVLLKGGHEDGLQAEDWYIDQERNTRILSAKRIASKNTHGTGCTLSSAICAYLALGESYLNACRKAKVYLHGAITSAAKQSVGKGNGPVAHFYQHKEL